MRVLFPFELFKLFHIKKHKDEEVDTRPDLHETFRHKFGLPWWSLGLGSFSSAWLLLYLGNIFLSGNTGLLDILDIFMCMLVPIACVFGLVCLFFASRRMDRVVRHLKSHDMRFCAGCSYHLEGLGDKGVCPECGTTFEVSELREHWQSGIDRLNGRETKAAACQRNQPA